MKRNFAGFDDMFDLFRDMEGFFPVRRFPWKPVKEAAFVPAVECYTREGSLVLKAELPGVDPSAIEISVLGDQLILRGEKKEEKKVEDKDLFFKEISFGRFERTFTLPEGVKADNVKATMNNGILELTMPMGMALTATKVPVQIGEGPKKVKAA